jgi:hypothetical protein
MSELYVTYDGQGAHYLAIIVAPERPASFQFSTRDDLEMAMDSLGNDWELWSPIQVSYAVPNEWLEQLAELRSMKATQKPDLYLAGQGAGGIT